MSMIAGESDSLATIDLAAIQSNVATLVSAADGSAIMAVVKANGYGHGAVPAAKAALLGGATWLGVASLDEGLELRASGIEAPVLAWLHPPGANFGEALGAGLDIGVSSRSQLVAVADAQARRGSNAGTARVHLKLDTGLGRNGAPEKDWPSLFELARALEIAGVLRVWGIFSHVSNATDEDDERQRESFALALALALTFGLRPKLRHLASTAASVRHPAMRFDMIRTGIGIYGLSPFGQEIGAGVIGAVGSLRPAMTLAARVVAVAPAFDGDAPVHAGILPLGYGDGIPPQAAGQVAVSGQSGEFLVTRIESDHLFVEPVLDGQDISRGDQITLFGDPGRGHPPVEAWAKAADTINYEVVTRLGSGVPRRYTS